MSPRAWSRPGDMLSLLLLLPAALRVDALNHHNNDENLFHFKSRPDLKSPRWNVKVHQEDKLTEGYWFVGVKPSLEETIGTHQFWFGPHIYDGNGDLVWSGADQFDTSNVMDFRISNVKGKDRLTVLDRDRHIGLVLDNHYEIVESFQVDPDHGEINAHEMKFTEDGNSVLTIQNNHQEAAEDEAEQIGWKGPGGCKANYMTMREYDATDHYNTIFEWNPWGHIRLNESTQTDGKPKDRCNTWDFIHTNSLDKCPDGDYLYSGRHTSTIYKISHETGEIVWRLGGEGGVQTDFDMGEVIFSRQHDIRCRGQNDTHTFISFLDNAKGQSPQDPTWDFSRGLFLALGIETSPMTVTQVRHYDHPYKDHDDDDSMYAQRRGNMQMIEGGNVFMGWSEQALHSEHTENGTLLMEAVFKADWLGSYRNYKFPFEGIPLTKPDVYAVSYWETQEHDPFPKTEVAVSWNGDTEVRQWSLYAVTDKKEEFMDALNRTGFETSFEYDGYFHYVRLEGLDKDGKTITDTGAIKTVQHPSPPPEHGWEDAADKGNDDEPEEEDHSFLGNPSVTFALLFILGLVLSAVAVLLGWLGYLPLRWLSEKSQGFGKMRAWPHQYKKVAGDDIDLDDEPGQPLMNGNGKIRLHSPVNPP